MKSFAIQKLKIPSWFNGLSIVIQVVKKFVIILREKEPCNWGQFCKYVTSTCMIFASLKGTKYIISKLETQLKCTTWLFSFQYKK